VPVRAAAGLTVDQERDRHWADSARFGDWSKYESAVVKVFGCRPHEGGAARTGAGVRKPPMEMLWGGRRRGYLHPSTLM